MTTNVPKRRLPLRLPEFVIAAAVFLIVAGNNLLMPLYPAYGALSGAGTGTVTLAFSFFSLGIIPSLILLGGLSDRVGRKLPILLSLAMVWVATAAVTAWPGITELAAARFLQGASMALMAGSATAWLADVIPGEGGAAKAANKVAAMMTLGFALSPLATGLTLMTVDTLRPPSYWVHLTLTPVCFLAISGLPDRAKPDGRDQSTTIRLPRLPRALWFYSFANFCSWAAVGVTLAVVPAQLRQHGLVAWAGIAAFLFNGAAFLAQPVSRKLGSPERAIAAGAVLVPTGFAILVLGATLGHIAAVLTGAALTGAGAMGFTFPGGLAAISERAGADRAGAVTGFFLWCYLGFCIPTCIAGYASDTLGLLPALTLFGAAIAVVSGCSIAFILWGRRPARNLKPARCISSSL